MSIWQALFLGALQGLTEFLPISSSGHLVLAETWLGLQVEKLLVFDVILHAGTLVALVIYFWKDLVFMAKGLGKDLKRMLIKQQEEVHLRDPENPREQVWFLLVATIPIVFLGPFLKDPIEMYFRSSTVVVMMLGLTALFLALAELIGKRRHGKVDSLATALLMGFFQVLAVIPGVSRSGSTIVGGLLGGLKRDAAARFAFLMAIPAIGGATVFLMKDLFTEGFNTVSWAPLVIGFLSSAVVSYGAMWGMLKYLQKRSLWVFVVYLLVVNFIWWMI